MYRKRPSGERMPWLQKRLGAFVHWRDIDEGWQIGNDSAFDRA
jgi:hypothetical protein